MDISCIISSGDLELYVLGMLSQEDNVKVVQLAQLFPEVKKEIEAIEQALIGLGDEADTTEQPSAYVKIDLFNKLRLLPTAASDDSFIASDGRNKPVQPDKNEDKLFTTDRPDLISDNNNKNIEADKKEGRVISMQQPKRNLLTTLMLAASVIALIACVAVISHLSSANTHYHEVANNLQKRVGQLEQTTQTYQQSLQMYQSPVYLKINLIAVPGKPPDALVQLFWNKATHDVYAADISLPQAPAGKQYQLWAIVDGKPVNAGLITTKKMPQQMINFVKADAFAITLEKAGGSAKPTLTEMYVKGKTS